jgi:hypothetical protein
LEQSGVIEFNEEDGTGRYYFDDNNLINYTIQIIVSNDCGSDSESFAILS